MCSIVLSPSLPGQSSAKRAIGEIHGLRVLEGTDLHFVQISDSGRLSQTSVGQIVQDDQGFIWLGTQYGLNRYDGYNLKTYLHRPGSLNGVGGVYIYSLFKDRSGIIWIGCDQSLDRLDPSTERFTHYSIAKGAAQPVPITQISEDHDGFLWLGTSSGLYRFDPRSGATVRFGHDAEDPSSLSDSNIKATLQDRSGAFWVVTSEGLDELDPRTGKTFIHVAQHEAKAAFLMEDKTGQLWVSLVSESGPFILDRKTRRLVPVMRERQEFSKKERRSMGAMLEDRNGEIWMGSRGSGLLRFDRAHRRFIRYRNRPGDPNSLPNDTVNSLFEDHDGNVWVGLGGNAPCLFSTRTPQFRALLNPIKNPNDSSQTLIASLFTDKEGNLWVGSYGALRSLRKGGVSSGASPKSSLDKVDDVVAMAQDGEGNLWLGTFTDGLKKFNLQTGKLEAFRHDSKKPSSLSNDAVVGLLVSRRGVLWISTYSGLDRFNPSSNSFTTFKPGLQEGEPLFLSMAEGQSGNLWVGTHFSGIYRFDPIHETFKEYTHDQNTNDSISNNRVNSVFVDSSGDLWAATQSGVDRFDPLHDTFHSYYESDGLAGNAVSCILEDARKQLWMGTNKGISKLDIHTKIFANYTTIDGLPGNDMTGWAACSRLPTGELVFGGFDGGVSFNPKNVTVGHETFPLVLTALRLAGREAKAGSNPLGLPISLTEVLTLDHTQDNFSLEFSALSFIDPLSTRYRYKLQGIDHDWNLANSVQRVVTYTKLPAGTYHFVVEAASGRGLWQAGRAKLTIRILPPWWATWWFRISYLLTGCAAVLYAYWARIRRLKMHYSIRLEERVNERSRIARELHDTLLQGFQGLMLRFQVASDSLPVGERSRELITDALHRSDALVMESRERILELRFENESIVSLEDALRSVGMDLQRPDCSFEFARVGEQRELRPVVREEVYLIAREALLNAFRHAESSTVRATIKYGPRSFGLAITDDGKGIDPQMSSGGIPGHWGIVGMKERAAKMGGRLKMQRSYPSGTLLRFELSGFIAFKERDRKTFIGMPRRLLARMTQYF